MYNFSTVIVAQNRQTNIMELGEFYKIFSNTPDCTDTLEYDIWLTTINRNHAYLHLDLIHLKHFFKHKVETLLLQWTIQYFYPHW